MVKYNETVVKAEKNESNFIEKLAKETDPRLISAFEQCSEYVKFKCNFDIKETRFADGDDADHLSWWVEDGVLFLGRGDNGYSGFSPVLSSLGTDEFSIGSSNPKPPQRYNVKAFDNEYLVTFLKEWDNIKREIDKRHIIYNSFEVSL